MFLGRFIYSCTILYYSVTSFEIQVLNMPAIKCHVDFRIFSVCLSNTSEKKTAKDSAETFVYYVGNGFCIPQHFAKCFDLVF